MSQAIKRPRFNIEKATEAVAYLLQLFGKGKPIKFMRLLKLLYLADREALQEWERPITYDNYVSMDHGQVLSNTYNLMKRELQCDEWNEYIQHYLYYWLILKKPIPFKKLSRAEVELLKSIFDNYGKLDEFELAELTHDLPEYEDPEGSSLPTPLEAILNALEYSEEDIQRINIELEEEAILENLFES